MARFDRSNENQGRGPHPRTIADMSLTEWLWIALLTVVLTGGLSFVAPEDQAPVVVASACHG